MGYLRILKFATSICKYKNHPTLNQNACFSSLVGLKSPSPCSIHGYPNNLRLVKHYHNGTLSYYTPKKPHFMNVSLKRTLYFLGSGLVIYTVYEHFEKIPYTNRTHFVFAPPHFDKWLGDLIFQNVQLRDKLSEEHPDSVRVKMIGEQIVEALESDLKAMKSENVSVDHLRGLDWEFIVVDKPIVHAYCVPGGKIVVYTGLLKELKSDAEIATIIGHQVGRIVARHGSDAGFMLMSQIIRRKCLGLGVPNMDKHNAHGVSTSIRLRSAYPKQRREQSEADHIGLLVMALAGYDPQRAPKVHEIFEKYESSYDYAKKRAEKLGEVMKEASSIYSKVIETRKMDGLKGV